MIKETKTKEQETKIKKALSKNLNNMHSEDKADLFFNLIVEFRNLFLSDTENFKNAFLYDEDIDKILLDKKGRLEEFKKEYKIDKPLDCLLYDIIVIAGEHKCSINGGTMTDIEYKLGKRWAEYKNNN